MEIEDIQQVNGKIKITFVNDNVEEVLVLKLTEETCFKIAKYCQNNLSYGAKLKKENGNRNRTTTK